ncbi:MAG: hypothetical protein LBK67_03235, partial [Coriobacteriales bacterium]|nr:hypothetical protein [Coriobacteriales bacterium]
GSYDPYWSQFAYYTGSSRASYYSGTTSSEEPADTIGIFAPSVLWDSTPSSSRYAYSIGGDFGVEWLWNTEFIGRPDLAGDCTPGVLYAADAYGVTGYASYRNTRPTVDYLKGKNPGGSTDRLGSDVVFLFGHGDYHYIVFGDYEYAGLFGTETVASDYMCGVWCDSDGQSQDTQFKYAGLSGRDLSGTKLISFVACNTAGYLNGDDDGNNHFDDNLCKFAIDCDAQAALGFTDKIHPFNDSGLYWLQKYNDALAFGYTIFDAVEYAKSFAPDSDLADFAQILGDSSTIITP